MRTAATVASRAAGLFLVAFAALWLAACSRTPKLAPLPPDAVVLAFGDSLTYGTGATPETAYPARLEARIQRRVVASGVPGETTAEGLARLPGVLAETQPRLVLLCLGGNDMLRGVPHAEIETHLRLLLKTIRASGAQAVLIGVPEPKVIGGVPDFYARLAGEFGLPYAGDIMNTVLKDRTLKSDPIHPNAAGYDAIANRLAELLHAAGAV